MQPTRLGSAGLLSLLMCGAAYAEPGDAVERLKTDLLGQRSATEVLTQWCSDLHLASPVVIRAERDSHAFKEPSPETRMLLRAADDEPVRYRQVRLMCGNHILSEADNWYLPEKLTADMNRTLDETDRPFGAVVRALGFTRKTLDAAPTATVQLQVRAVLSDAHGTPFSLVIENYSRELTSSAQ